MKKIFLTILLTFSVIAGIFVADYTINSDFIMVKTEEVTKNKRKRYINATGTCFEQNKREIRIDLPFAVDKIYVKPGDKIKKGQKILSLNKESLLNKIQMQNLSLSSASNDNLIAKINNFNNYITSPIDGVVTKLNISDGSIINTNLPVMIVSDLENLIIKASVPESIIGEVFIGQNTRISGEYLDKEVMGEVVKIHPVAERSESNNSQSFVLVDIAAKDYKNIRPQTTLKVEFEKKLNSDSIIIPFDSVMFDEEKPYVFINNMGYAAKRYVNLGEEFDIDVEVLSGVKTGDKLIVNPKYEKINEGDKLLSLNH